MPPKRQKIDKVFRNGVVLAQVWTVLLFERSLLFGEIDGQSKCC